MEFWLKGVHVAKSPLDPVERYKIITGVFEIVVPDSQRHDDVINVLVEAGAKRPLSKFGIHPIFRVVVPDDSVVPEYWYEDGKFWEPPGTSKPIVGTLGLTSNFVPQIERVLGAREAPCGCYPRSSGM